MGKNTTRNIVLALGAVVGLALIFGGDGVTNMLSSTTSGVPQVGTFSSTTVSGQQDYQGTLTLTTIGTDKADPSISYGGDTEYTTICYKDNDSADPDDWTPIATATNANPEVLSVPIQKASGSDSGSVDMRCDVDIGGDDDFYFVSSDVISDNSRVTGVIYDDANNDNVDSWIYTYNLLDISPADPNTAPTDTVFYKLIIEASSDTSDPASVISVGQGSVKNTLKFKNNLSASGAGEVLNQVQIRLNSTDDTQWFENLSHFTIAGIGTVKLSEMDRSDLASTTVYKYTLGTDASDGNMMYVEKDGDTELDAHVVIQSNFDASDEALCVELQLRTVDAQGAFTTTSDDAEIAEGTNSAECTL